ncbi:MAG: hypothetical protein H0X65_17450, partial [Gemmatimonadetes bacterium]|nr:hypothetical protein [Gemmatimonadota bacterium]
MRWKRVAARTVVLSTLIAAASCEQFDQRGLPTESDLRAPAKAIVAASTSATYTTDEDFAQGTLVNVNT